MARGGGTGRKERKYELSVRRKWEGNKTEGRWMRCMKRSDKE